MLYEELTHLKRPWCWERSRAGGEGDDRGWEGWMALLTQWTWVWVDSRSWWWTGRPDELRFVGSQRVGHDWVNWTENALQLLYVCSCFVCETSVPEKLGRLKEVINTEQLFNLVSADSPPSGYFCRCSINMNQSKIISNYSFFSSSYFFQPWIPIMGKSINTSVCTNGIESGTQ